MTRSFVKSAVYALGCVLSLSSAALSAQQPLKLEGSAFLITREVDEQGKVSTRMVQPDVVVPGDMIVFTTTYENVSRDVVSNFVVTNPIPASVQLATDADPDLMVSVDGGASWGRLRDLEVTDSANSARPARASDVTHLRWVIDRIAPNESGKVEYVGLVR